MFRVRIAVISAAFVIAFLPMHFAFAGGLVEHTKGLIEKVGIFNGKPEPVCDERPPVAPPLPIVSAKKPVPSFKSEGDLRKYLDCYVVEPGRLKIVTEKYLPLIAQAAKDFGIPQTLLTCLIFRESRFNIDADSGRQPGQSYRRDGAIGLGQHVRITMSDISRILSDDYRDIPKLQKIERTLSAMPRSQLKTQELKDLAFSKTRIGYAVQVGQWESYFKNLANQKRHLGPTPKLLSENTVRETPSIAIGATALYLQSILSAFKETLDPTISLDQGDGRETLNYYALIAAAGAYNIGPGAASGMLEDIRPPNPKKWIERLKKSNEETAGHLLSIENCISSPASNGAPWKGPMGSPNNDCSSPLSPKPVLPGGINVLPPEYRNPVKSATLTKPKPKVETVAKPSGVKKQSGSIDKKAKRKEPKK